LLGELKPSTPNGRPWKNGSFEGEVPLNRIVGDPEALQVGQDVPKPEEHFVSAYGGILSSEYDQDTLPYGVPLSLWLHPSELEYTFPPAGAVRWMDASGLGRTAAQTFPAEAPDVSTDGPGGSNRLRGEPEKRIVWPANLAYPTGISIYLAGVPSAAGIPGINGGWELRKGRLSLPNGVIAAAGGLWFSVDGGGFASTFFADQVGVQTIWCVRFDGTRVVMDVVGVNHFEQDIGTGVECVTLAELSSLAEAPGSPAFLNELIVFDRFVDDDVHAKVVAYLTAEYP